MCWSEYKDQNERKFKPSDAEKRQIDNANHISKALTGQLSYTTKEWLKKEEYIQ